MTNYSSSVNQKNDNRQPQSQTTLQPEQKVYLYGDIQYTGTLIRPLERTYPPKWTVELDGGGYEAVNMTHISLIESQPSSRIEPNLEIPFSDSPEATTSQLEKEIIALKKENALLKQENQQLTEELTEAKQIIRRAKDISPVMRLSLQRVMRLAHQACMDVRRSMSLVKCS